jgi:hypothetical protein
LLINAWHFKDGIRQFGQAIFSRGLLSSFPALQLPVYNYLPGLYILGHQLA